MTSKTIQKILKAMNLHSPEIEASALMTRDGIVVSSVLAPDTEPDRIAAMCAALIGLGDTAAAELDRGKLKLILLHGEKGVLLLVHVGDNHALTVSASTEIKLGAVLMEARKAAASIQLVLE